MNNRFRTGLAVWAAAAGLLLAVGCTADQEYQGPELIAVDGIVTLDAQPLAGAELVFIPTGDTLGQGAVGQTDAHGRFVLTGHRGQSGAPRGCYRVIITKCVMPDGSPCPERAEIPPMDSMARQILPDRYSSYEHSGLIATVQPGEPLEFHLTSTVQRGRRW
jgi:hypothetical protein